MTEITGPERPKKPKIVLLFPSPLEGSHYSLEIPLSILAVAAPLHADGYEVVLIDERLHEDPEAAFLKAADGALCVGVSTITGYQLKRSIDFSRLLKSRYPDVPVVWGGYHPSLLPELSASEPYVDAVVRGQGERSFQELIGRLEEGRDLHGVAGVTFQDKSGEVVTNPARPMDDVNEFPAAPYHLLDIKKFFQINGGRHALQYISSQGCPFKCTFCVEPHVFGKWSGRSAEKAVAEIKALDQAFGLEHVTFSEPNFFVNKKRAQDICRLLIKEGLNVTWSAAARADQLLKISPEMMKLMADSGCFQIGVGMESGSREVLNLIDKRITPEKALDSNEALEKAGIHGDYAFMVGFPKQLTEAQGEIWQTLMLIKKIRKMHPDVITLTFYVTPYPGTPIYDIAVKLNLKMPRTTEEWAEWESTTVSTTWISEKDKDFVERCNNYYFPFAYPNTQLRKRMRRLRWKPVLYPLHWLAALRCWINFYGVPMEWRLMQLLSRTRRFRRVGSQIDALRGYY